MAAKPPPQVPTLPSQVPSLPPEAGQGADDKAARRASRQRRLEHALRDNLRKRKRQARARAAVPSPEDG